MIYDKFINQVFDYATQKGLKEFELFSLNNQEFEVMVSKGEIERYKDAGSGGASFKVIKDGKCGYSFTEKYDSENVKKLIDDALENLGIIETDDRDYIFSGNGSYTEMADYQKSFEKEDANKKINMAVDLEKRILEGDSRIKMVTNCMYMNFSSSVKLSNSRGLEVNHINGGGGMYAMAVAKENESSKSGFTFSFVDNPEKLDIEKLASQAIEETVGKLGAKPVSSGKYRAIIRRDVFGSFLSLFVRMISAEAVQKGFSLFKDKLGQKIFSENINISDLNYYKGSMFNTPFDSQGVPTHAKNLVKNGVLQTYLHSLKTANKDGVAPTGNAFRRSYKGKENISSINLVLEKGNTDYDSLKTELGNGIIITDVQGMHSGANPVSGDFSLGAEGYMIENGKITFPVEQITIAGNLIDLFSSITAIGNDVEVAPEFSQGIYTPSILINEIEVAG